MFITIKKCDYFLNVQQFLTSLIVSQAHLLFSFAVSGQFTLGQVLRELEACLGFLTIALRCGATDKLK